MDVPKPVSSTSTRFMDRVTVSIRSRGLAYRTEKTYCLWIKRFIKFHGYTSPDEMQPKDIEPFLSHLAIERFTAINTQRTALNALVFLFREFLKKEIGELDFQQVKNQESCLRYYHRTRLNGSSPRHRFTQYPRDSGTFVSGDNPNIYPCGGLARTRYDKPCGCRLDSLPPGRLQGTPRQKTGCLLTMAPGSELGKFLCLRGVVCAALPQGPSTGSGTEARVCGMFCSPRPFDRFRANGNGVSGFVLLPVAQGTGLLLVELGGGRLYRGFTKWPGFLYVCPLW